MHGLLTKLFGGQRKEQDLLYRLHAADGKVSVYVYSDSPVSEAAQGVSVCGQKELTAWVRTLQAGQAWGFDLLVSPTKKVPQKSGKNSQRRILRTQEERLAWLNRKAEQNGFALLHVTEQEQTHPYGKHQEEKGGKMYLDAYHYQGRLEILDAERFRRALSCGIGAGKPYGMGMLILQ